MTTHIDYTATDAAALLDGATGPLLSAADVHQAQQDARLDFLEAQLSRTLDHVLGLVSWRVQDVEPWRQETYQRLARLEEAETHRRMNEAQP